ncbi:hypothetical protein ACFRQM_51550 [Streptomyces sp. NPDC056831]|uniref:hypothetical protein n=1 Tax=Streptomyces sp. NPDC056831 TaxID=3345954 RepID=UPI0036AB8696
MVLFGEVVEPDAVEEGFGEFFRCRNVRRYFKPSPDAIAEITSLLAPGDSRR